MSFLTCILPRDLLPFSALGLSFMGLLSAMTSNTVGKSLIKLCRRFLSRKQQRKVRIISYVLFLYTTKHPLKPQSGVWEGRVDCMQTNQMQPSPFFLARRNSLDYYYITSFYLTLFDRTWNLRKEQRFLEHVVLNILRL